MVVRKNISLEQAHLKKLEPLTQKHGGNLSAAIRDAIDIAEASLRRYSTVEEAISSIGSEKKGIDLEGRVDRNRQECAHQQADFPIDAQMDKRYSA